MATENVVVSLEEPVIEKRGPGFTMTEDLIVCKSFIATSEDPIAGRSQKGNFFKNKMFIIYNEMIKKQTSYEKTMLLSASGVTKQVYATNTNSTGVYPVRKEDSVYERFTKKISPEVSKYMGILETHNIESGQNKEDHQNDCLNLYLQRYGKQFDYMECYNYLCDKVKFILYKSNQSDQKKVDRPIGNKMAKKAIQDASLIKLALEGMKDAPISDVSTNSMEETVKKDEALFYKIAANFLDKTGDALNQYMVQQKLLVEKQNEDDFIKMLPSPEKKIILQEKVKLYIAELRAKRRKLNENVDDNEANVEE